MLLQAFCVSVAAMSLVFSSPLSAFLCTISFSRCLLSFLHLFFFFSFFLPSIVFFFSSTSSCFVKHVPEQTRKRPSSTRPADRPSKKGKFSKGTGSGEDRAWEEGEDGDKRRRTSGRGGGRRAISVPSPPQQSTLSHDVLRTRICIACLRFFGKSDTSGVVLNENMRSLLPDLQYYISDCRFSVADRRFPIRLCYTCRTKVTTSARDAVVSIPSFDAVAAKRNKFAPHRMLVRTFVCPGKLVCPMCKLAVSYPFGMKPAAKPPPHEEKEPSPPSSPKYMFLNYVLDQSPTSHCSLHTHIPLFENISTLISGESGGYDQREGVVSLSLSLAGSLSSLFPSLSLSVSLSINIY